MNQCSTDRGIPSLTAFIRRLTQAGLAFHPHDLRDLLWMARFMASEAETGQDSAGSAPTPPAAAAAPAAEPPPKPQTPAAEAHFPAQGAAEPDQLWGGLPLRTPTAEALPGKLELARALRPLMKKTPSRVRFELDEEATVQRIAETQTWAPALRPAAERWLDLTLLTDASPSMAIWGQTTQEFRKMLYGQGAFRQIRALSFADQPSASGSPELHLFADNQAEVNARTFSLGLAERTLTLIVSDGVSPAWHEGRVADMLKRQGQRRRLAFVQLLPERHWRRSALGRGKLQRQTRRETLLYAAPPRPEAPLMIPVIALEPSSLKAWADYVSGQPDSAVIMAGLSDQPPALEPFPGRPKFAELPPEKRAQLFQASASPLARQLAGYFAAVPLRIPLMHLIRQKMLPASRQSHLAEVFLSGLLKRLTPPAPGEDPNAVDYDIDIAVQPYLLGNILVSETLRVIEAVSEYIQAHHDVYQDFPAALKDEAPARPKMLKSGSRSFALIHVALLNRLGGYYADLARRLSIPFPRRSQPLTVSKDDYKTVFKLNENRRPMEYVKNEYQDNGDGTITDYATGLMWQQSGTEKWMYFKDVPAYIKKLNQKGFAGYHDWRLPTTDELLSLLEPQKNKNNDLYIDPIFDKKQWWCWSADLRSGGGAWGIYFNYGDVDWYGVGNGTCVRLVRRGQ